jgi:hypothetical protein
MTLYHIGFKKDCADFYARNPQHIVNLITHYYEENKKDGGLNDPKVAGWSKKIPSLKQILAVEKGNFIFHQGVIDMSRDGNLFEKLCVAPDFDVNVTEESIPYFDIFRREMLPQMKRKELYKIQLDGLFGGLTFIPEDVVKSIRSFDLTPYIEKAKEHLQEMERMASSHPNLAPRPKLIEVPRPSNN